jgi:FG-GAP-like repeat/Secretion system C-terminal sorting domain
MKLTIMIIMAILLPILAMTQEWDEHSISDDFEYVNSISTADIDGDGDIDVAGSSPLQNEVQWWENVDGSGVTWSMHEVDDEFNNTHCVYAVDMDDDGDIDLLGAAHTHFDDDIIWWENLDGSGVNWVRHVVTSNFFGAESTYAIDMDGDGDIDVLGAAEDAISWWENASGNGLTWVEHPVAAYFYGARCVYAEDVDGDGDVDILGAAYIADDIRWWENTDGNGENWTVHFVDPEFDGAACIYATDIDSDGDTDILGAAYEDDEVTWWENTNGDGLIWIEHVLTSSFGRVTRVYAADMDNDGDVDVLSASQSRDDIRWWENTGGDGQNWSERTVESDFQNAEYALADDVDGDGDLDILCAAEFNEVANIAWWENPRFDYRLELVPWTETIYIFPIGGTFLHTFIFTNPTADPLVADVWVEAILPGGGIYPVFQVEVTFPEERVVSRLLQQNVPGFAPAGVYQYVANVGQYPDDIYVTDSFEFTKLSSGIADQFVDSWSLSGWNDEAKTTDPAAAMPGSYALESVSPNPFNPSTLITVSLEGAAELSIVVYNVTGQQVAELANEQYSAGTHQFTFDASNMASGLYFVRAAVPGHLDAVQKLMLVR